MTRSHWWAKYIAIFAVLTAAVILAAAYVAAATDVNVTQSARCVDALTGRYDVTVTAHNTYTQTLHLTVNNPASPIGVTLNPDQTWAYTFHVVDGPWTVKVTTSDAVLHGDTLHTWTLTDVCGVPAPTTTAPPVTSCLQANPPRDDCTPTTSPTTVPGGSSTPAPPPPASAAEPTTGPPDTTPVPARTTVPGAAGHPTAVAQSLPVTGMGENVLVAIIVAGSACIIIGSTILMARSRGRD